MPGRVSQASVDAPLTKLLRNVPKIFDQAQNSTTNHQKNFVALYKLHVEAAQFTEPAQGGRVVKLIGERSFEDTFKHMVVCVLPVKKGVGQSDRIIKFIGGYTRFVNEKAAEEKADQAVCDDDDDDGTASRFTAHLLGFLIKGFVAKDKNVRYRSLCTVAEMVSHLGEIDEDLYNTLRAALLERVTDKEASVRVQAVIALSKLCGSEDPSEMKEGETVQDVLLESLAHDTSADVRRAIFLNIPITPATLPNILERTRDTDTTNRKVLYNAVFERNITQGDGTMGVTHPRVLSITQRELIVRNGLGDREPAVRSAAGSLIGRWVDAIDVKTEVQETGVKSEDDVTQKKIEASVLTLLKLFDLTESTVATDALLSVFTTRTDIFNNIEFGDAFWSELTPEKAFLARVFVEHCKAIKDETRLEAALPVVTALAFRIQESYNRLMQDFQKEEEENFLMERGEDEKVRIEDDRIEKLFIIGEMLKLAVNLDFSDEIGRRKMFQLVRDMLSQETLPEILISSCLDVLRTLSVSERDLIRVVVEIVHELRDTEEDEEIQEVDTETNFGDTPATVKTNHAARSAKPPKELSSEEKARADFIDLKCLSLCIGMLERVNGTLEENVILDGILSELIFPSVNRNELPFQEKGLMCLGLCCLIAKRLALKTIQQFLIKVKIEGLPEVLRISLVQIIIDVLMVHEGAIVQQGSVTLQEITDDLISLFSKDVSPRVMALLSIGISKLALSGLIMNPEVIKSLVLMYFNPSTVDNLELRQCLTFFFSAYCYSSPNNQQVMRKIFFKTFVELNRVRDELEDNSEMVGPTQVASIFLDWTDPIKLSHAINSRVIEHDKALFSADEDVQIDMAIKIIRKLLKQKVELGKEEMKALFYVIGKVHIPEKMDDDKLRTFKLYLHYLRMRRPPQDITSVKAITRLEATLSEKFAKQLEDFSEAEYRKLEELKDLFEFLDSIIPEDDDEVIDIEIPKKKGRKRRSDSIISTSTENDSIAKRGKRSKKPRVSYQDDDSDDDDDIVELDAPPPQSAPKRVMPKRAATSKISKEVIVISSGGEDEEDEEDEEEQETPRTSSRHSKSNSSRRPVKVKKEKGTSSDGGREESENNDSIYISDSEDEEEEVNDLLADE